MFATHLTTPGPPLTHAQDNPLHISLFPPHLNEMLDMSFLLNSCLDIFDIRTRSKTVDQDLGLLQAIDERLATYGWLTNTGVKFIIVVDMAGRPPPADADTRKVAPIVGLRDSDLKSAFRAVQTAYIQLLLNPFYTPDTMTPLQLANSAGRSAQITSKRFISEVQRIGKAWFPGVQNI